MNNIIQLAEHLRKLYPDDDLRAETFLVDEGLDMLAAYRAIKNRDARMALVLLARAMALPDDGL